MPEQRKVRQKRASLIMLTPLWQMWNQMVELANNGGILKISYFSISICTPKLYIKSTGRKIIFSQVWLFIYNAGRKLPGVYFQ